MAVPVRSWMAVVVWLTAVPAIAQTVAGDDAPLRFGRFSYQGKVVYGFVSVGGVHELDRSFLARGVRRTGRVIPLEAVKILAPVVPGKVIGVALNYASHGGAGDKGEPGLFAKLPSAVIGPGEPIVPPPGSTSLHYEGEMVIVMARRARKVPESAALDYVMGVTIGNDVSERGFDFHPFQVLKAKGADTLSPLGPWIVPGLNYDRLRLETFVNGKKVQSSSTAKMIHSTARLVAVVSRYFTLEPGDVIYTGTPGTTAALKPGDVVEVRLEGVGRLRNPVARQ